MDYIDVNEEEILYAIDEVEASLTASTDDFQAILLKSCKCSLAKPLQILFQRSLANDSQLN